MALAAALRIDEEDINKLYGDSELQEEVEEIEKTEAEEGGASEAGSTLAPTKEDQGEEDEQASACHVCKATD